MTTLTDTQVITASGGLVELGYSQVTSGLNVTATTDSGANTLIGNFTVVCDGSPVLVEAFVPAAYPDIAAANRDLMFTLFYDNAVQVSRWGLKNTNAAGYNVQPVSLQYRMTPTAGAHTFSLRAHVSTGTGRIDAGGSYGPAFLRVSKIVQATQWPAVTTGTIICTSSTRPASPFEGQRIYQTDNDLSLTWNGSSWVASDYTTTTWPSFLVYRTSNQATSSVTVKFDGSVDNVGSCYNSTTGLFTAPVAGLYHFSASTIHKYSDMGSVALTWYFYKNSARLPGAAGYVNAGTNWTTSSASTSVVMAANDTMGVYLVGGWWYGDTTYNHNNFTGHLVRPT